jgi:hypothetical protein
MASIFFTQRLPGISKAKGNSVVSLARSGFPKSRLYAKSLTGRILKRSEAFNADFSGF